ncbi:MAG: hypothetical protein EBU90_24420 [Proteobacteria bacterium]|nr:hypothetical protein [Pseudomonadota bacterium]
MDFNPIQNNFNAGEIDPLLHARNDLQAYVNGLQTCYNYVPRLQGVLSRRSGTKFIKSTKYTSQKSMLVPFIFNNDKSFILEFGDLYIRFYKDRQAFISGTHYEIVSPYADTDLFDNKGIFRISFAQSADVIYMAHRDFPPKKLKHIADNNWTISNVATTWGAFDDLNTSSTTIYASASTGTVTLTASAGIFASSDVGTQIFLQQAPDVTTKVWEVDVHFSSGDVVKSGGRYYRAASLTDGTAWVGTHKSGTVIPSHQTGKVSDGLIDWLYLHSGYGYATITGYTNSTTVTASVKSRLPENIVGSSNESEKWAFGAWNPTFGYPEFVCFFKERLVYARDIYVWFSVVGDYDNFALRDGPDLAPDMGINLTILSNEYNGIKWIYPFNDLIIGTQGTIHVVAPNTTQQVFSASNIQSFSALGRGCLPIRPRQIDSSLLFVQRSGEMVLSLQGGERGGYVANDISLTSNHLFKTGIKQIAYQERPDSILWVVRNDGKLIGLTINETQEVKGWHIHELGGDGIIENIAIIPSPNGNYDDIYLTVLRDDVRTIEYMAEYFNQYDLIEDAYFVDCGKTYSGTATKTITGLSHLAGKTVTVLANGAVHPPVVVSGGGSVTLNYNVTKAHIGYNYTSKMVTLPIEGGTRKGTPIGKTKRINKCGIRVLNSVGGKIGTENKTSIIASRTGNNNMNQAVSLFSGTHTVSIGGAYETESRIEVTQEQPLPMTILAIMPEAGVYD